MKKGELTRERIIRESAPLFNKMGYSGVSLTEIIDATGIQKGGLYRHFAGKDEIALEAYDYAAREVGKKFDAALAEKHTAFERLMAFFEVYGRVTDDPPFEGGCPMQNTAVEHDDGHPRLLEKAKGSFHSWRGRTLEILRQGMESGEFRTDVEPESVATFLIAALEGGILLSKLEGSNGAVRTVAKHVETYLRQVLIRP